jgi:hypothetical protein
MNTTGQFGNGTGINSRTPVRIFGGVTPPAPAQISVTISGAPVAFPAGVAPVIQDDRTLVPVRGVFEHLGFDVVWEPDGLARTVDLVSSTHTLRLFIDSQTFYVNGAARTLDVAPRIIGGSTMLPLRQPLEAVGLNIGWNPYTRTVLIYS